MNADKAMLDHLTERIAGSALTVSNALGAGFLAKKYENARVQGAAQSRPRGCATTRLHRDERWGHYALDPLVQGSVIVELKAIKAVAEIHRECINDLRATGLQVCLLLNFGNPRLDIKRVVLGL